MLLTESQLVEFNDRGFLFFPGLIDTSHISDLQDSLASVMDRDGPEVIREQDGEAARLVFGAHTYSEPFGRLSTSADLVLPVRQLLGDEIYLHQSRINPKLGMGQGGSWTWHQDYPPWKSIDGMPRPRCVMATVFLDDCSPVNSPLLLMPGSQQHGLLESHPQTDSNTHGYDLHQITTADLKRLAAEHGIEPLVGPAGSVALIHCNVVHGSANNVSPWRRAILYLIYNAVSNACTGTSRPWYQNNRDFTPLQPGPVNH
ncbi:MAG: proline hydroxylase [Planctomycetaceae bacterium]|jgi:ectoine hydroxylase|nr:proline hydroxylase [Planctomycetaceae bacterium]MDP7274019.1 phytanoyl-CoA dioxygenase family protein [Planctomycetaceae bacterium]